MLIESLKEIIAANAPLYLALGGFAAGFAFGAITIAANFCTMGSISDIVAFGDYRRFRSWILAAATAMLGAQLLHIAGAVDLGKSMYLSANLNWLGNILGGLIFGFGMVLAGGCASRNTAKAGTGDLRAVVILLVVGLFAYIAIGGVLGPPRDWLERSTQIALGGAGSQALPSLAAAFGGIDPGTGRLLLTALLAGSALIYCFAARDFRASPVHILAGIGIGLCVAAGWAVTGLAFDEFAARPAAPISLTYVRPAGDAMEYLRRFTAEMLPAFGVATVFGAILGGFAAALATGRLHWSGFANTGDTARALAGGAMMGIGGVMALGCTIGQAITGVSALALGSFLAFIAMFSGGVLGVKYLEKLYDT